MGEWSENGPNPAPDPTVATPGGDSEPLLQHVFASPESFRSRTAFLFGRNVAYNVPKAHINFKNIRRSHEATRVNQSWRNALKMVQIQSRGPDPMYAGYHRGQFGEGPLTHFSFSREF